MEFRPLSGEASQAHFDGFIQDGQYKCGQASFHA
jgi:hypothetical protein